MVIPEQNSGLLAMGELQMLGRGSELLSNVGKYSVLLSGRDHAGVFMSA